MYCAKHDCYSDESCPFCGGFSEALTELLDMLNEREQTIYANGDQGDDFWEGVISELSAIITVVQKMGEK